MIEAMTRGWLVHVCQSLSESTKGQSVQTNKRVKIEEFGTKIKIYNCISFLERGAKALRIS